MLVVADDTGLEIDALDGAPGVYAARYAGPGATYADNVTRRCASSTACRRCGAPPGSRPSSSPGRPAETELVVRGEVEGLITSEPRGANGFGYDSVFEPLEGDGRTFAEMTADEKHALSHRGRALRALVALVKDAEDR